MKSHDNERSVESARGQRAVRSAPSGGFMALQASVGNQAVLEMMRLQRAADEGQGSAAGEDSVHQVAEPAPDRAAVEAGLRSPGRPLDRATLARKETQFQADLTGVRLHTGPSAEEAAAAVQARAFTVGQDIVIGKDGGDFKTLDHELTHTVRNLQGPSAGHPTGSGFAMTHPGDREEREAESNASRMSAGGPSAVMGQGAAVRRSASGRAAVSRRLTAAPLQRAGAEEPSAATAAGPEEEAPKGKEIISRLSQSIELHTVQKKSKSNVFAPGTWWPEQWMIRGPARLRKTLDRRVMRGETFNDEDLADIKKLSEINPQWLADVGIGTYSEAEKYTEGPFDDWLKLPAGKRVLTATLAVRRSHPVFRDPEVLTPTDPAYTLGRFMETRAPGTDPEVRQVLERERDQQIRDTAVDTLHPEGIAPGRRHEGSVPAKGTPLGKGGEKAPDFVGRDAQGREMLTRILLVLRHGLQLYSPEVGGHAVDYEKDVIRALAHGGRVNVRIPALSAKGDSDYWLPHFLGVTKDATKGETAEGFTERDFATHRTSISANKSDARGTFKEKGGILASVTNKLSVGAASPKLWGKDISGGGIGSKDWNGNMVLPNGSYGHVLLVYHRPTTEKDGSLQIGIETIAPHAASPVGYQHDFRSTEATSNPESVLHGHKADKTGSGGLGKNERYVDLQQMGAAHRSGDWRTYLDEIQRDWEEQLAGTEGDTAARRALYQQLVGPRARP
ncbi:DUF4157 domain-containing protein [Streptomyces sp. 196(2019)]|uniref:eCIS core domain-containing protein n=1 Tax=Streptomyces sp. 196(2019) TaxID=2683820 RepID=UPI0013EBBB99|nr:DUF4157 domain-containing protein [Streptomyces sp. 196(2019)]NGO84645.1 DUF4157 domain-containing protein [Streptomyces sp. 196(2019)]